MDDFNSYQCNDLYINTFSMHDYTTHNKKRIR